MLATAAWPRVAAAEDTANVLVLYSENRLLPATIEVDQALHESDSRDDRVRFFTEFLDAPFFTGPSYEARTAAYLSDKYSAYSPRVIVAGGLDALRFVLKYRATFFPNATVIHVGTERAFVEALKLPTDVIGVPADYDVRGTLELAMQLRPHASRLVVVTGTSAWDQRQLQTIRTVVAELRPALAVEYVGGLPMDSLTKRLAALSADAIVLTPGFFRDGTGRHFTPRQSVELMAADAAAPVFVFYSSQLGSGALGGRMTSYRDMGRAARVTIDALLGGAPASSIELPNRLPAYPSLDARQLARWNVPQERIPQDARVHFRQPSFWETYRSQTIIIAAVLLLQGGLISALLFERQKRRRTALALAASEQRSSLAMRAARLQMFVWDFAKERTERASPRAGTETDADPTQESFDQVLETAHPADRGRLDLAARKAVADEGELDVEYRSVQPDGAVRWMAVRGQLTDGQADALTGFRMDITSRKVAELQSESDRAALTHVARVATMGQLSAAIAHQLNQPLAAILGNAETARKLLLRDPSRLDDVREILDDVIVEDLRAADIIRRLDDLYRRGETETTAVDLNELVSETLDLVRAQFVLRQIAVVTELCAPPPTVRGSRIQLQQVVLNLVLNAADAMALTVEAERVVTLRTTVEPGMAHLCVKDRGTGIAPADLKRIFEPVWTTKSGGLGMGLAICKTIVAAHRGTLSAHDNPDGGAALCLDLPVEETC